MAMHNPQLPNREEIEEAAHRAIVAWSNGDQPKPIKVMVADAILALIPSPDQGEACPQCGPNSVFGKHSLDSRGRPVCATPPVDSAKPGEDLPEAFEKWWETSKHRSLDLIGYSKKKCLAFDAFEAGSARPASLPEPQLGVER